MLGLWTNNVSENKRGIAMPEKRCPFLEGEIGKRKYDIILMEGKTYAYLNDIKRILKADCEARKQGKTLNYRLLLVDFWCRVQGIFFTNKENRAWGCTNLNHLKCEYYGKGLDDPRFKDNLWPFPAYSKTAK